MADDLATMSAEDQAAFEAMRENAPEAPPPTEPPAVVEPTAADGDAAAEDDQQKQRRTMVPHAALNEERDRRKAVEARLEAAEKQRLLLEERTNLILQRFAPPPAPEAAPAIPDPTTDPVGHIIARLEQQDKTLSQMTGLSAQARQELERAQQVNAIQTQARAMEQQFSREHPDYDAAVNHLVATRDKQLELIGYDATQRAAMIQNEGLNIAAHALQSGRNPAEVLYALSSASGYQPAATAQQTQQATQQQTTDRINTVADGQRQSQSLGNTRGRGPVPMTAQRLLEMPEAEFAKMLETREGMELLGLGA